MSGQQERIPTGEWRKVILFVMPVSWLHELNITLRPHTLDCLRIGAYSLSIQQIIRWFWCHQWTLSHTGLQGDVVVVVKWAEHFYYADILSILSWKRCCHIPYNNMECGENPPPPPSWEMTFPDICHVMQCSVTCISSELTTVFFINRHDTFRQIKIIARESKI